MDETRNQSALLAVAEEVLALGQTWMGGAAVVALATMLPLAFAESRWVPGLGALAPMTAGAAMLGLALGRQQPRAWAWVAAVLAGPLLALIVGSGALSHPGEAAERLVHSVQRLQWWASVVWLGGSNDDPLAPMVVAGGVMWMACLWMGWATTRLRAAMPAVLPLGAALAANTFFGLGGWGHLVSFVPLSMVLLVAARLRRQEDRLTLAGVVTDPALRARSVMLAAPVAAAVLATALLLPPLSAEGLADAFWEQAEAPWRRVVRMVKWLFPGLSARGEAPSWLDEATAGMPSARELTGSLAPDEQVIMYVRTSDPPPPAAPDHLMPGEPDRTPKRYWRGMTYDVYTGRGWANSRLDVVAGGAGEAFQSPEGPRQRLVQDFEMMATRDELLFAVGEPVMVNSDPRLHWRGGDDLAFLKAPLGRYSVVSLVPVPDRAGLRSAGMDYPPWVHERYLTLPEVPDRVRDLARQVTDGLEAPYDRLVAIESYLRENYDYDLAVLEPAEGKDVVDYFLFEAERGFCDYYASAMVVLARLSGVPARLASGYATGEYDYAAEHYVVTAGHAHSWPEAYFPGYGWIEFEPTVAQSTFWRPAGQTSAVASPVSEVAPEEEPTGSRLPRAAVLLAALVAGGGVLAVMRRRREPSDPVLNAYLSMEAASARLGVEPAESLTPRELARRLEARMEQALKQAGGAYGRGRSAQASAAVASVALAYERRRYASDGTATLADVRTWRSTDRYLRGLALRQWPRMWRRRLTVGLRQLRRRARKRFS